MLTYLQRYEPDAIRYGLAANMPENADTDFTEAELVRRNNDELVATWGNLVNRVLAMAYRTFDGHIPQPAALDHRDEALLEGARTLVHQSGQLIEAVHLKAALTAAMAYAQEANAYLNELEPWKTARIDRERTATTLYVAICAINALKIALYPFLPFSSQRIHEYLGYTGDVGERGWRTESPEPGSPLRKPEALFPKIETASEGEARLSA